MTEIAEKAAKTELVRGTRIAKNSALNLVTGILTSCLGLIFVPIMLHAFGTELYGVLSVTWMVLGYLAWLDLGLSRASAKFVAQELVMGRLDEAASWAWTALLTQTLLALAGAIILSVCAPTVVKYLHVATKNRTLVILALHLFAFSIPISLAARSLNGVLQAGQRFGWINTLSVITTISTYIVYALGIVLKADFRFVIYGLFVARFIELVGAYLGAVSVVPGLKSFTRVKLFQKDYRSHVKTMITYGSWVTVASILGPVLLTFDQWMITIIVGVALLPFYTVPFNLLMRLNLFSSSLLPTLFPSFSALHAKGEWDRIETFFIRAHRYLLIVLLPILFVLLTSGPDVLRLWLGPTFAAQAGVPLQILAFGFGIGMLAPFTGTLLEAVGRPDILSKVYLVELPLNIATVYWFTKHYGINGAALSYTVRTIAETVVLWIVLYRVVPFSAVKFAKQIFRPIGLSIAIFAIAAWAIGGFSATSCSHVVGTTLALVLYSGAVLTSVIDKRDRQFFVTLFRKQTTTSTKLNSPSPENCSCD